MRSKCSFVKSTEVVSPFSKAADIWAAVFFIILLHQEFAERGSAVPLVQVRLRALDQV